MPRIYHQLETRWRQTPKDRVIARGFGTDKAAGDVRSRNGRILLREHAYDLTAEEYAVWKANAQAVYDNAFAKFGGN